MVSFTNTCIDSIPSWALQHELFYLKKQIKSITLILLKSEQSDFLYFFFLQYNPLNCFTILFIYFRHYTKVQAIQGISLNQYYTIGKKTVNRYKNGNLPIHRCTIRQILINRYTIGRRPTNWYRIGQIPINEYKFHQLAIN